MYGVKGDGITIYNDVYPTESAKAVNPKLTLKDNSAGSLEITLPPGNAGYGKLERMVSEMVVYRDNDEIWSGRIIGEKKDFWNNRILTCEGELAYLNDTTQPPNTYSNVTIEEFLDAVLAIHNERVEDKKRFVRGAVEGFGDERYTFTTDDEVTLAVIQEKLIEQFKGHLIIRKGVDSGERILDYKTDDHISANSQEIRFGLNLLDFTRNWDATDFATVVVPRGARLDSTDASEVGGYLDVSEVNGGSRYVTNEDGIKSFGWIEVVVDWGDITDANELLEKARSYLSEQQFENMVIEVTAVDLRYLGVTADSIRLLDKVRCVSTPHGLNHTLPVSELTIQLDKPENSTYILSSETKETAFTSSAVTKTESKQREHGLLQDAFYDATQKINSATRGVVTIVRSKTGSESIAILSSKAYVDTYDAQTNRWSEDACLWRWNFEGLAFSTDGGRSYDHIAITADGQIVADSITTGTLSTVIIEDIKKNSYWNLSTGEFKMRKGTITLGSSTAWPDGGLFHVTDDGYLRCEKGLIGGFTIEAWRLYNDTLRLDSRGLTMRNNAEDLGYFGTQYWTTAPSHKGITMSLDYSNNPRYIVWSNEDYASDGKEYTIKLAYAAKEVGYPPEDGLKADRIQVGCDFDLNGWAIINCHGSSPTTEYVGTTFLANSGSRPQSVKIVTDLKIDSDGKATWNEYPCYVVNGIISKLR